MSGVVLIGSLNSNRDPVQRVQIFELIPVRYATLDEGIAAAKDYHRLNCAQGEEPRFRVYTSAEPDGLTCALVEVAGNSDMVIAGLYKVVAGSPKG